MSSRSGALLLLVLVGIGTASAVNYISANITNAHRNVAHHLDLTSPDIGRNPLFGFIRENSSCPKKHNLPPKFNKTLDIYTRIFSIILDDTATPVVLSSLSEKAKEVVRSSLRYLQRKMLGLKKNVKGHGPHRTDELDELDSIQVGDVTNQKKALAEYKEVYQAANVCYHHGYMQAADSAHSPK
ncbi:hypothetical protein OJAV_G00222930 [Oryzias javanicus]|uniref:Interleukin-6 n=1 Tax=Oryzias javanicus TaxID=123683 RepID=A0A3S2LYT3_ORYJA|nr:hypothetical protein OJAV_G00222930 [Oryzias javanicus]